MESGGLCIAVDDAGADDVRSLINTHLAFAHSVTPVCQVHALDVEALTVPGITVFTARRDGRLLGVGALKELDHGHAEIKSMHTSEAARGQGVGRAIVEHLLTVAGERGYDRVSLETGTGPEFAPARALYRSVGFEDCEPFGDYEPNAGSVCMTIPIVPA